MVALAIALLTGSFAISAALTAFVKKMAVGADFVCRPAADRYQGDTQRTVPLGGGIAISTTLVIVITAAMAFVRYFVAGGHFGWIAERANVEAADFLARIDELAIILLSIVALFARPVGRQEASRGVFQTCRSVCGRNSRRGVC